MSLHCLFHTSYPQACHSLEALRAIDLQCLRLPPRCRGDRTILPSNHNGWMSLQIVIKELDCTESCGLPGASVASRYPRTRTFRPPSLGPV